ncbi:MAG: tyrosine-protein phosphatase [Bacteroidaceae bacterium]|nr:tyrosine-protein phosphatase [Bacteroidaceae bacterium]
MKRIATSLLALFVSLGLMAQSALTAGTYYIQNKSAGTFLSSGATWGTRAVLSPHGVDFRVTVADGKYTLTTQIQGASKGLRPSDGYMDQSGSWTIEPQNDGTYALFNGTNYFGYAADNAHPWVPRLDYADAEGDHTHWRFLSREALLEGLAEATRESPVDATFLIQAPDLLIGDYRVTGTHVWGSDLTAVGGITDGSSYVRNNANGEKFNTASYNITQTLSGIPNGIYTLSVQGFYRNGSNSVASAAHNNGTEQLLPYLYAGSKRTPLPSVYSEAKTAATGGWATSTAAGYVPNGQSDAAKCFDSDAGVYLATVEDIVVVDGTLAIGIAKDSKAVTSDWACFDNFTLLYHGSDLSAVQQAALEEIARYEALNTTADEDFAEALATQRAAIEAATSETDIAQALEAVRRAYSIYYSKPEPTDTPLPLNPLLENPSLGLGTQGWDATLWNNEGYNQQWTAGQSAGTTALEAYAGYTNHELRAFQLLQPVTLAPGLYRLKGYAFYRYGTSYNSDLTNEGEGRSLAYLVAGEHTQKVMRLGDIAQSTYPNTLTEAAAAFDAGQYLNSLIFELDQPTTLLIGFRGEHSRYRSWFVAGPVTLEKINEQILAQEAGDAFELQKTQYGVRWESYKSISSQALEHADFDQFIDQAKASLPTVVDEAQLAELDQQVWAALTQLIKSGTTATGQFDLTSLLVNPAFNRNTDGWQTDHALVWDESGLTELFNQPSAEVSQVLPAMPAGHYTLKAQAFYRMTTYGTSSRNYEAGQDDVRGRLFLNLASQPVKSINDDARYRSSRPASDVAGAFGRSIPNTLNGVNDAFAAGLYWNILRADVADDGDLKLGLQISDGLASNWMPFDNFRLYYGAPTVDVELSATGRHTVSEDTYANVTTDIELLPDHLNAVCWPFDIDASYFQSVWTVASVEFGSEARTLEGTLVPFHGLMRAGEPYLVRVAEPTKVEARDVVLHCAQPDSVPVLWEGAAMQGYYGQSNLSRTYRFEDDSEEAQYAAIKPRVPGYRFMLNLPTATSGRAKTISLHEVNLDSVAITVNLENLQARAFLNGVTYAMSSSSVIADYNRCPPGRRDQPHNAVVPVPRLRSMQKLTVFQGDDSDEVVYTRTIPAGTWQVEVPNLTPQRTYRYLVTEQGGSTSTQGTIKTEGNLRMIYVPTISNVRDLGGWRTQDGLRTRYGLVYRGGEMNAGHQANEADLAELQRLGIGAEIDLREDIDIQNYNVTSSAFGADAPYIYLNQNIWGDDALEQDTAKYHRIMDFLLSNLRAGRSVYFHCIWGADRTGATAFLLEGLLGLTYDQMYKDYELTSFSIAGSRVKTGLDSKFTYIRALTGRTLQEKFLTYWRDQAHVSEADLLEFIQRMTDGEPSIVTAVEEVREPVSGDAASRTEESVYDLSGRRVAKPAKGLYITGGRKVVIR